MPQLCIDSEIKTAEECNNLIKSETVEGDETVDENSQNIVDSQEPAALNSLCTSNNIDSRLQCEVFLRLPAHTAALFF